MKICILTLSEGYCMYLQLYGRDLGNIYACSDSGYGYECVLYLNGREVKTIDLSAQTPCKGTTSLCF